MHRIPISVDGGTPFLLMLSLFSAFSRQLPRAAAVFLSPLLMLSLVSFGAPAVSSPAAPSFDAVAEAIGGDSVPVSLASLSASAAVLLHPDSGEICYGKNADVRMPMASTTKIMTALVAIEAAPLSTVITVVPEATNVEGSSVYLYPGETLTLETLLYALLLESANDAAAAIAYGISGSIEAFADRMNARAQSLGLTDTHFMNPHGLDHAEHYTTAYELAQITIAALKHDAFRTIVSTRRMTAPQSGTGGARLFINHNRLLSAYDGCIGVKTGYTKRSGRCLVSAAERDGLTLIAVTLSAPNDWSDHTALLDLGFSVYESVPLVESDRITLTLPVLNGVEPTATASFVPERPEDLRVTLRKGHGAITTRIELPRHLWGSYQKGDTVGRIVFLVDGSELCAFPLTLDSDVREIAYRPRLMKRLRSFLRGLFSA